jgi:chemotaxis protein CheZ
MSTAAERDSDELEALFDSIASSHAPAASPSTSSVSDTPAQAAAAEDNGQEEVEFPEQAVTSTEDLVKRLGQMTRNLHDNLRELGYHSKIEEAARAIPDTRERLDYVANLTGQAAEKVLTLTELSIPVQSKISAEAAFLSQRWQALVSNQLTIEDFEMLVQQTRDHLKMSEVKSEETAQNLRDIMMAQDFHDLTGQVLRKVTDMAQALEIELITLLVDSVSPETRANIDLDTGEGLMNGPVTNTNRADIVANQSQVDDLLATLGF